MYKSMIDAASGGALVDLTPVAAKNLIPNMAANSQQFRARADQNPRRVNEVNHSSLEHKVEELTSLMHHFITWSHQQVKSCGIYSNIDHATDMCQLYMKNHVNKSMPQECSQVQPNRNTIHIQTFTIQAGEIIQI